MNHDKPQAGQGKTHGRLPFPTWRDLADTLASQDPDQRVTDDDPRFWVGLWLRGMAPDDAVAVLVEF